MDQILEILSPVVPACMCFGPVFIVIGIILRTPVNGQTNKHKRSLAYLVGGAVMITLAFLFLFTQVMSVAGH